MLLVLKLVWLMMPAYFANMASILTRKLFKKLAFPPPILFISFFLIILVKHAGYLLNISEEKW